MTASLHLFVRQNNESDPILLPVPVPVPPQVAGGHRHANSVIAFIIGLSIIILASVLNAAGLNLTKLDHVQTRAVPKSARKKSWLRPLWLLGMFLYILSQLIGSTLALEYMRAEYVAPLGSTSLIFNFLFARFLVGSPVTATDIYGTIIVILGVVGIVAFGSINSGLSEESSAAHLAALWGRLGWLGYFFLMSLSLGLLYTFTTQLDVVLSSRSDLSAQPFAGMSARTPKAPQGGLLVRLKGLWNWSMIWITEKLEEWTAGKDDTVIAWTLGIGWACAGGGLAGECLVFAKASVKLISGSISRENTGNQLGHPAPIFTFIFLALTAVLQIVCLNRGLEIYDSTLVVPVFYGVYTATGWLNSLIFNDAVDAFASWTLFLIFVSILILISGVVLLTHKKREHSTMQRDGGIAMNAIPGQRMPRTADDKTDGREGVDPEDHVEDGEVMWDVGEASDEEEEGIARTPRLDSGVKTRHGEEGEHLMTSHEDGDETHPHTAETDVLPQTRRRSTSSALRNSEQGRASDGFGEFEGA
ncbi:hypothetical protein F5148DRAFT_1223980 [Russula earlei]|uniref:Uncharacterized protein n=1 Tax=Russula earlei TaxID=71964 RepID=A0ACC0U0V4_9AGAM|nr:hypothetical protein F5148DRAFT_1223980 [Russula earlei]